MNKTTELVDAKALSGLFIALSALVGFSFLPTFGIFWFPMILLGLSIAFLRLTIVDEGTAKAIMRFGAFHDIFWEWKGHWMDEDYNIWKEPKEGEKKEEGYPEERREKPVTRRIFGGLYLYFWPFEKIHHYKHRWTDTRQRGEEFEVEFHEEIFYHVLLKPAVYSFLNKEVETKPPERVKATTKTLSTFRIYNPFKFLFVGPPTPVEDVQARQAAEVKDFITTQTMDELLSFQGQDILDKLKDKKVFNETMPDWGFKQADKGLQILTVKFPAEIEKAAAAKREQELRAAGRAQDIMGTVISAVAAAEGREIGQVQEEFKNNAEAFYQKHMVLLESAITKLSMEERAYLRIETPGADGLLGSLLTLAGALQRMPTGPVPVSETSSGQTENPRPGVTQEETAPKQEERELSEGEKRVADSIRAKKPMEKLHEWRERRKKRK